jgi:hypothetical protein
MKTAVETFTTSEGTGGYNNKPLNQFKITMTAVEWLEEQTRKPEWHSLKRQDIFEQAKEMEMKHLAQAFDDGEHNYFYSKKTGEDFENGIEYYNEKFKQQEQ